MQIAPFNYIKRSKSYDASKWPLCGANLPSPQADLMVHLPQIREDHVKFTSELARYSNEVIFLSRDANTQDVHFFVYVGYNDIQRNQVSRRNEGNDGACPARIAAFVGMDLYRYGTLFSTN